MPRRLPTLPFSLVRAPPNNGFGAAAARPSFVDVSFEDQCFRVAIRRAAQARRFTLRVGSARRDVLLTIPKAASVASARAFAHKHAAWIAERLQALTPPVRLSPGAEVPVRGVPHVLEARTGLRRRVWIEPAADGDPPKLCVCGPDASFETSILVFLKREASTALSEAVSRYAAIVKKPVKQIRLRDTRSRWGSCSSTGTLNFSWRLILAPSSVLDYLAAHEVAHLVHMDHSAAFWAVTHKLAPHAPEAEAWLKTHGRYLHRYGEAATQ